MKKSIKEFLAVALLVLFFMLPSVSFSQAKQKDEQLMGLEMSDGRFVVLLKTTGQCINGLELGLIKANELRVAGCWFEQRHSVLLYLNGVGGIEVLKSDFSVIKITFI